jgi:hypothetical protein
MAFPHPLTKPYRDLSADFQIGADRQTTARGSLPICKLLSLPVIALEWAYFFRAHAFHRLAAVEAEESSEPVAGQEGYVESGAEEQGYAGPVRWRFDFLLQASIVPFDFSKAAARCRDVSGGNPATGHDCVADLNGPVHP